jgi:hypothetical protein
MIDSFCSLSLFYFEGFSNRWWALSQMKLAHESLSKIEGLSFYKLLGSGAGDGFKPYPNWGVYAFLGNWDNPSAAQNAFDLSEVFQEFKEKSIRQRTFILQPTSGHGHWSGTMPFVHFHPENLSVPIAVLTRARIKWNWLIPFWIKVPSVNRAMKQSPDLVQSIGIGELPLIEQATFSIWKDRASLNKKAYGLGKHKEAVTKTRRVKWYSEEMFVRFNLVATVEGLSLNPMDLS